MTMADTNEVQQERSNKTAAKRTPGNKTFLGV